MSTEDIRNRQNPEGQEELTEESLNELRKIRRDKLKALQEAGRNPFLIEKWDVTAHSMDIRDNFDAMEDQEVSCAGRIMAFRNMGKASFIDIQDKQGRIQCYVRRDAIGDEEYKWFKTYDIGDIVGVEGTVFRTQHGEVSIKATKVVLLTKSLQILPDKWHGLKDTDLRYRQRYVDLIVNPEVREVFIKRARIISTMRRFFDSKGYLEVETPILQSIPGGANARPFITHHNTLNIPLYLRIADELYLKRLIVGGYAGVYEFSKNFRNEGMDRTHNPEFTCMEIYVAYKDYNWMMDFVEQMLQEVVMAVNDRTKVTIGENEVEFGGKYRRLPMLDAIKEYAGVDVSEMNEEQLREVCKKLNVPVEPSFGAGKLIDAIFGEYCEKHLIQPTFITDYPVSTSPLTKRHRSNPNLTERFELFVCGKELANAYSELNDPIDQLERFKEQLRLKDKGDDEAMFIDMDFIRALEYGMPPTSGMGIGIDRLTMFMTNQATIQDVLFFPQMRPESKQ